MSAVWLTGAVAVTVTDTVACPALAGLHLFASTLAETMHGHHHHLHGGAHGHALGTAKSGRWRSTRCWLRWF